MLPRAVSPVPTAVGQSADKAIQGAAFAVSWIKPTISKEITNAIYSSIRRGNMDSPWEGDPGRTLKKESAKRLMTMVSAEMALKNARTYSPFADAKFKLTSDCEGTDAH